jgi:hypothetical protein
MTPTHAPDSLLSAALAHAETRAHAEARPWAVWERRHAQPSMVTSEAVLLEETRVLFVRPWGSDPQPQGSLLIGVVTAGGEFVTGDDWQGGDAYVCSPKGDR